MHSFSIMRKITISGSKDILLIYLSIFIVQNYGVNANILGKTKEKVCNIQEAICPPNKCCSDKICKEEELLVSFLSTGKRNSFVHKNSAIFMKFTSLLIIIFLHSYSKIPELDY